MAAWPTVAEVKASLGVTASNRDSVIAAALGAAIEQVCQDLGYSDVVVATPSTTPAVTAVLRDVWEADDEQPAAAAVVPNYATSQAALILAVMTVKAPDAPYGVAAVFDTGGLRVAAQHPTYRKLLTGNHLRFGVA